MFRFGNERLRDRVRKILAQERAAESPPQVTVDGEALHGVVGVTVSSDPLGNPAEIDIETDGSVKPAARCAGEEPLDAPYVGAGMSREGFEMMRKRIPTFHGGGRINWPTPVNTPWTTLLETYREKRALPDTDDQVPAYRIERVHGGFEVQKSSRAQRYDVSVTPRSYSEMMTVLFDPIRDEPKQRDAKPTAENTKAILAELALPSLYETQWRDIGNRTYRTLDKAERWLQSYVSDAEVTTYDAAGVCLGDSNE